MRGRQAEGKPRTQYRFPRMPTACGPSDGFVWRFGVSKSEHRVPHRYYCLPWRAVLLLVCLAAAGIGVGSVSSASPASRHPEQLDGAASTVVARYRVRIPELMAEQGVPGLAVALVDEDRPLWVEGFGHLDGHGSAPVDGDTIFGVQSTSKLFTATAVVRAAATGWLDLDEPITTYLPRFTIHSAFERHPERKITLRMLLSHTAGLTHEAPTGNNNELVPGTFDDHVRSISRTWLRFPVGTGYAYSNLGIDLAGYILQRVAGRPFANVMHDSLLEPLGMDRSTFGRKAIRASSNRALGHVDHYPEPPLDVPMTAAGGLYTSAHDLARFLRFQLNGGSIDGRVVLDPRWLDEMRTVPRPRARAAAGYALGVVKHRWETWPDLLEHGGGGYGFLSDLWWSPEIGIGIAVLTNSQDHQLQNELAVSILADVLREPGAYRDRMLSLPWRAAVEDPNLSFDPPAPMATLIADAAMKASGDRASRWAGYTGLYRAPEWDVVNPEGPPDRFVVDAGVPYFDATEDDDEPLVRHRLAEVQPGLFLADNGETLDLRGHVPTWRNLRLVSVSGGPAPWQWAILGGGALLSVTWFAGALARTVRRSARRPGSLADQQAETLRWRMLTAAVAASTALLILAIVALLAWRPGLVDSGFLGWLDLTAAERIVLHLPLALVAVGALTIALVTTGSIRHWWSPLVRLQYAALAAAAAALSVLLVGWDLVGWGM